MQVEADYDLHDKATKMVLRNQATEQHCKNMKLLTAMVEHCTVQKCDQPWPGLYSPTDEEKQEEMKEDLSRTRGKAKKEEKAVPAKKEKAKKSAGRGRGRKAGQQVAKQAAKPHNRTSRSQKAADKREQDQQPVVEIVSKGDHVSKPPPPPPATQGSVFNLHELNQHQPSSPQGSSSDVMSSASTQWMHELKKQMEEAQTDMKKMYEQDVLSLREQLRELQLQHHHEIAQGAHFKALYEDAKTARDEWKGMVLQLLPTPTTHR